MKGNQEKLKKLEEQLKDKNYIVNIHDLIGDDEPSSLFYFLVNHFGYLLDSEDERDLADNRIYIRKKIHAIIDKLGPMFLTNKQVIEDKNELLGIEGEPSRRIELPNEPVIFAGNHRFKDDVLATVLAAKRHGYILFGSVPQFYNTFDGVTAYLNGVIMGNRKVKESRNSTVPKSEKLIRKGTDLVIFPEGVWNKTPNQLMIDLWPGIYRIAKSTGAKVVPICHYLSENDNMIHTVIDEPIQVDHLSEEEGLQLIRDTISSWYYLLMEKYGKTTREEVLKGKSFDDAWEEELVKRVATADRYDREIELCADFRPRKKVREENVFENIASVENITPENVHCILDAKKLVKEKKREDFQRRF